ncbi:alpha/beta-hydrolase [Dendrothele bispora CBS 962.96]|uniref:feruloyl esterase n=1 Tax=Dendrothele bispora (strain CBS 962.96) TaxID=1314807 RepID=A0A4S8LM08_DENBC|nr:alpha/beta-hydrolase [Dendrothele bispora CBS 962.96]
MSLQTRNCLKRRSLLVFSLFLTLVSSAPTSASSGCGKRLPSGVTPGGSSSNLTITSKGLERNYLIHLPDNYDVNKPTSMVFSFHGRISTSAEQEELSQLSNPDFNPNAIAVYPNGIDKQWLGDPDAPTSIDDIQFTSHLIDHLAATYCIDSSRIYMSGFSNGGGLVGLLACDPGVSAKVAAFATVSGAFYLGVVGAPPGSLPACHPARTPIPLLNFHGLRDPQIAYFGGDNGSHRGQTIAVPEYLEQWVRRDGIRADAGEPNVCQGSGHPRVVKQSWGNGVLQHYNESNLEHTWPSESPNHSDPDGSTETCYEAAQVIMDFFGQHTL